MPSPTSAGVGIKDPNIERPKGIAGKWAAYQRARARRDRYIEMLRADPSAAPGVLAAGVGVTPATVRDWRRKFPEFGFECDSIRGTDTIATSARWTAGFAQFRKQFFGFDSPPFQLALVDVLEHGQPGSVTLVLLPPEHGKTTTLTDYQCYKLSQDPNFRITYASEKQDLAVKVGKRMRERMARFGTARMFVLRWGPFEPEKSGTGQAWGAKFFSVRKRQSDDQEYSWQAVGFGAAIAGSRCDLLIVDDMQSRKSINQTTKMIEELRQDWLSRPGSLGRTVIIGTRVGDNDVYEALEQAEDEDGNRLVSKIVRFPAVRRDPDTGEAKYLWPERYTPENYDRMKAIVGPAAWARNYQQDPRDSGEDTFTDEVITAMSDDLHAWEMPIPDDVRELAVGLDPAVGGHNAFTVQGWAPKRLVVLEASGQWGLTSYDQIFTELGNLLDHWARRETTSGRRVPITTVVVEDKAFQHGLLRDQAILELQQKYGFAIVPHQTGNEKNDQVIGVTGMVRSARRSEIIVPNATDPTTIARCRPLLDELRKWRPNKRGNRLRQDKVMALWFGWLQWRKRRDMLADPERQDAKPETGLPLPWAPMKPVRLTGVSTKVRTPFSTLVSRGH